MHCPLASSQDIQVGGTFLLGTLPVLSLSRRQTTTWLQQWSVPILTYVGKDSPTAATVWQMALCYWEMWCCPLTLGEFSACPSEEHLLHQTSQAALITHRWNTWTEQPCSLSLAPWTSPISLWELMPTLVFWGILCVYLSNKNLGIQGIQDFRTANQSWVLEIEQDFKIVTYFLVMKLFCTLDGNCMTETLRLANLEKTEETSANYLYLFHNMSKLL